MKIKGFEVPQTIFDAIENRMRTGSFDAQSLRTVLTPLIRAADRSVDVYYVSNKLAHRLIAKYADEIAPSYYEGYCAIAPFNETPEDCADSDMSYWG